MAVNMEGASPPVFEQIFRNARFAQGGNALFEGKVKGNPKPQVVWTRKGLQMKGNDTNKKIPKYYVPQLQSGLSVIESADFSLFVNSLHRICPLSDLRINNKYNKRFHYKDKFISAVDTLSPKLKKILTI